MKRFPNEVAELNIRTISAILTWVIVTLLGVNFVLKSCKKTS